MAKRKNKNINPKLMTGIVLVIIFVVAAVVTSFTKGDDVFNDAGLRNTSGGASQDGVMTVSFIDVGQGDCTLITEGDTVILVDAGESFAAQTVVRYMEDLDIDSIDCLIATHPHSDHIGGLPEVMESFTVNDVIMTDLPEDLVPTTKTYEDFLNAVSGNSKRVIPAEPDETYSYGKINVEILGPINESDNLNSMSVVSRISYGDTTVMLTGDAEKDEERDILSEFPDVSADILKVGHHGSKTSTCTEWLEAVDPEYAVISCGEDNDYGHPNQTTLDKLDKSGVEYYRTDLASTVIFTSDGKNFVKK
ncbi:MAG: ComEC/Rec2 family competence protein [Clostridia bacterium]|nr:ComEC/Rec2 family competence protein [Clostridia bacterium]